MKRRQVFNIIDKYYGLAVGGSRPDRLESALSAHFQQLNEWSATVKLVGSFEEVELEESLYLDSLIAAAFLCSAFKGRKRIHDVGTGAGFPALFLPLYFETDASFVLHEARRRKASFLHAAAREMMISNLQVENDHVLPGAFHADAVLSRATFHPVDWLKLAETLLLPSGRAAVFIAGAETDFDAAPAESVGSLVKIDAHEYTLPVSGKRRGIAVYEKCA